MSKPRPPTGDMPGSSQSPDELRLLTALADHLHEHCECTLETRCTACDLRMLLMELRERLLAWRSAGRRLAIERREGLANGFSYISRTGATCDECAALGALSGLVGADQRGRDT